MIFYQDCKLKQNNVLSNTNVFEMCYIISDNLCSKNRNIILNYLIKTVAFSWTYFQTDALNLCRHFYFLVHSHQSGRILTTYLQQPPNLNNEHLSSKATISGSTRWSFYQSRLKIIGGPKFGAPTNNSFHNFAPLSFYSLGNCNDDLLSIALITQNFSYWRLFIVISNNFLNILRNFGAPKNRGP